MKSYDVSLQFETDCLIDFNAIFPEISSAGTFFESKKSSHKNKTLWTFRSNLSEELPVHKHAYHIISQLDEQARLMINSTGSDICLVIGVFHDTMTCSVLYTNELLSIINKFPNISIKSTCYPCQED